LPRRRQQPDPEIRHSAAAVASAASSSSLSVKDCPLSIFAATRANLIAWRANACRFRRDDFAIAR